MDDFDITNDVYHKRKRSMYDAIQALTGDILGASLLILAIGIPFAIYFWRM